MAEGKRKMQTAKRQRTVVTRDRKKRKRMKWVEAALVQVVGNEEALFLVATYCNGLDYSIKYTTRPSIHVMYSVPSQASVQWQR